jgi:hypothetical protein
MILPKQDLLILLRPAEPGTLQDTPETLKLADLFLMKKLLKEA